MADDWGLLEPLGSYGWATSDDAVLVALVDVERALVRAWGTVLGDDLSGIAESLRAETLDHAGLLEGSRTGGVPVIPLVLQLRAQAESRSAGSGAQVHAGATSQDILDSALVLVGIRTLGETRKSLLSAGSALSALAESEQDTLSIARTLGQHAAQTTMGISISGWLDGISSALEAIDRTSFPVQLGGAVGTGEDFERIGGGFDATEGLRAAFAAALGLADPGRDWHTERSPILHIVDTAAVVTAALGRIGREIAFLARTEINEITLTSTGGSSAMPHKRNPVDAVLLTANGLRAPGLLTTVHVASISQDARPAGEWHAEWQATRGLLRLASESASAAAGLLATLTVRRKAVERNRALTPGLETDATLTRARSARIVSAAIRRFRTVASEEAS